MAHLVPDRSLVPVEIAPAELSHQQHASAEQQATLAALEAALRKFAPAVFNDDPQPLAAGTRGALTALLDRCPWTVGEFEAEVIARFLADWTRRPAYLAAVARGDVRCQVCPVCRLAVEAGAGHEACALSDNPACLFRPRILPERDGVLRESAAPPAWAHGIDLRNSFGWQLRLLIQHAGTDPARLQQIADARGYKPGWVHYVLQAARGDVRRDLDGYHTAAPEGRASKKSYGKVVTFKTTEAPQ